MSTELPKHCWSFSLSPAFIFMVRATVGASSVNASRQHYDGPCIEVFPFLRSLFNNVSLPIKNGSCRKRNDNNETNLQICKFVDKFLKNVYSKYKAFLPINALFIKTQNATIYT